MILLSQTDRHPKISKNGKVGVLSVILHLSPADSSGHEVCPKRSAGCTAACLNYSGFHYERKYKARIARTKWYFADRPAFMTRLATEIASLERRAKKLDLRPGVRLNGTSDIPWERVPVDIEVPSYPSLYKKNRRFENIMEAFPDVCFMDYTKRANRRDLPDNYKLVFSRSEDNEADCIRAVRNGMNLAVVFEGPDLPSQYDTGFMTLPVIDGDEHDWRYGEYEIYDYRVCVGLRAKGSRAKKDMSGFIVRNAT